MGPFELWPTGSGFDYFYGFLGGETNPVLPGPLRGHQAHRAAQHPEEGYHFTEDMTDKAIAWIRQQRSIMTDLPFFAYYAPAAPTLPTMCRLSGQLSTKAASTRLGRITC